jgi:hypothetical protein
VAYRVHFSRLVQRQIASWDLPDTLLVELHLRLGHDLGQDPARSLMRLRCPFDALRSCNRWQDDQTLPAVLRQGDRRPGSNEEPVYQGQGRRMREPRPHPVCRSEGNASRSGSLPGPATPACICPVPVRRSAVSFRNDRAVVGRRELGTGSVLGPFPEDVASRSQGRALGADLP